MRHGELSFIWEQFTIFQPQRNMQPRRIFSHSIKFSCSIVQPIRGFKIVFWLTQSLLIRLQDNEVKLDRLSFTMIRSFKEAFRNRGVCCARQSSLHHYLPRRRNRVRLCEFRNISVTQLLQCKLKINKNLLACSQPITLK